MVIFQTNIIFCFIWVYLIDVNVIQWCHVYIHSYPCLQIYSDQIRWLWSLHRLFRSKAILNPTFVCASDIENVPINENFHFFGRLCCSHHWVWVSFGRLCPVWSMFGIDGFDDGYNLTVRQSQSNFFESLVVSMCLPD